MVKNPVLYDGHTLNVKSVLHPSSMPVTLKAEPLSTAQMMLPRTDADVSTDDWVRIYTTQGDAGVFRVKSVNLTSVNGERAVQLEHAFGALNDWVYFGKYNEGGDDKSSKTVINAMLDRQPEKIWALGTMGVTATEPWTFNNTTLLNAINTVRQSLEDSQITFDMDTLPFVFNIEKRPTEPSCEMRGNRNLDNAQVNIDRSKMYTRLYALGANDTKLSGSYVERNADKYGVISKVETNNSIKSAGALKRWAEKRLSRHCDPMITVTASGRDLSSTTGEPWDRLTVGTVCRVPLREYGMTICERIDSIKWTDVLGKPESVSVTLSNSREDVTTVKTATGQIAAANSRARSAGAAADDTAERVYRLDSTKITPMHSWYTSFQVTWSGVESSVSHAGKSSLGDWITSAQSKITQTADKISLVVSADDKIKAASIVLAINGAGSSVKISATHVDIEGWLHAKDRVTIQKYLDVKDSIYTKGLNASSYIVFQGYYYKPKAVKDTAGNTVYALCRDSAD